MPTTTKVCDFCDEPLRDMDNVVFVGEGQFTPHGPVPNSYGIGKNFSIDELYHPECFKYVMEHGLRNA